MITTGSEYISNLLLTSPSYIDDDNTEYWFINRDPKWFKEILDYLQTGELIFTDIHSRHSILTDMKFYKIDLRDVQLHRNSIGNVVNIKLYGSEFRSDVAFLDSSYEIDVSGEYQYKLFHINGSGPIYDIYNVISPHSIFDDGIYKSEYSARFEEYISSGNHRIISDKYGKHYYAGSNISTLNLLNHIEVNEFQRRNIPYFIMGYSSMGHTDVIGDMEHIVIFYNK